MIRRIDPFARASRAFRVVAVHAVLLALVVGCSSNPPKLPPAPELDASERQPVNRTPRARPPVRSSEDALESTPKRLYRERLEALQAAERRRFVRPLPTDAYGDLPGNRGVLRTVSVEFPSGGSRFRPEPGDMARLRELAASATRVEVRGRTDGVGDRERDRAIARDRALGAERYLLDLGVPHDLIGVTYEAGGDYVADRDRAEGRDRNRRVDIEFTLPPQAPLPPPKPERPVVVSAPPPVPGTSAWQVVRTDDPAPDDVPGEVVAPAPAAAPLDTLQTWQPVPTR